MEAIAFPKPVAIVPVWHFKHELDDAGRTLDQQGVT